MPFRGSKPQGVRGNVFQEEGWSRGNWRVAAAIYGCLFGEHRLVGRRGLLERSETFSI